MDYQYLELKIANDWKKYLCCLSAKIAVDNISNEIWRKAIPVIAGNSIPVSYNALITIVWQ